MVLKDRSTQVLDHGYVTYVEGWGSDEIIIESARMSTNKGFQGWGPTHSKECQDISRSDWVDGCICNVDHPGDEKLLAYLYTHNHMTPFEMAGMTIEVQAPIMVFREWHRHRTQSYNEMSGRYTELPNLYYIPSFERLREGKQSQANKQGSSSGLDDATIGAVQSAIISSTNKARAQYEWMLSKGVAREIARLVLPANQYSRMRASANLRNWLAFLTLRMAPGAQWEIRQYANVVASLVEERFPRTYALFKEGRVE